MKFLYLADTHLRTATPSCRKDVDFYQTQLNKLMQVIEMSKVLGVDYILHGGDLFDTHDPSTRLIHDVMAVLNNSHVPWYVNPGNHDIFGANTATLRRSGLGILWQAGMIETFARQEEVQLGEDVLVRFLPYSLNYKDEDYNFDKKISKIQIVVTHDMLTTHFVPYNHKLISELKTNADIVLCAHWHGQFAEKHNKTWFLNSGPLTRQTTFEARIAPGVGFVDIDTTSHPWPEIKQVAILPIKHQPPWDVINETVKEEVAAQEGIAEQFLSTLKTSSLESLDRQQLVRSVGEQHKFSEPAIIGALNRLSTIEKQMETVQ